MGYKKLSNQQEQLLVDEYISGASVQSLQTKYGFSTKKSIIDKVKKYYPDSFPLIIEQSKQKRRKHSYCFNEIKSEFDAYFIGLLLTDGYITTRGTDVGIDLIDEDCINFLAKGFGTNYKQYPQCDNRKTRYRLIISDPALVKTLERFGITQKKTYTLQPPTLKLEEEKFLPYIIRGIIDGDGGVSPTSYNSPQFYIVTKSEVFAIWIKRVLEQKMFLRDLRLSKNIENMWRIESADTTNILKIIALCYDKPFGMNRKYTQLRETFNDYNRNILLG